MNMPGFTAEASLYRTSELYSMRSMDTISTSQVVPQQMSGLARDACLSACLCCGRGENWGCCVACFFCV
jgi:hypothetical protein